MKMDVRNILLVLAFLCAAFQSRAGTDDTDSTTSLLLNVKIQIEANQALNDMYNFKFDKAEMQFRWIKQKYAWHPLPYFLLGLSQWWKILPNIDNTEYDAQFNAYMDTSLVLSKRLYKINEVEGAFFLAATHGFVARLESDRGNWRRAAVSGKNALSYVDVVRENTDFSPEVLFGDAIMNYYTEWIRDNYPVMRPIMWFFPKGDMQKGIEQLKKVAHNAFYTRTEAQYYLIRILANEENNYKEALPIIRYLRKEYPDNAYFHRFYASVLYRMGRFNELERESREILAKIDSGMPGYEGQSGRYAAYYVAKVSHAKGDNNEARTYYEETVDFANSTEDQSSWYSILSNLELARYYSTEDKAISEKHYRAVIKHGKGKKKHQKIARQGLKELKKIKIPQSKSVSTSG